MCVSSSWWFSAYQNDSRQQITKHRVHWLLGLIERKASLLQSASAWLRRNGHESPTSSQQAKEPRSLSIVEYSTQCSISLCEDSFWWGDRADRRWWWVGCWNTALQGTTGEIIHKNAAEQLIHFFVWLGQDLRDHETLVWKEVGLGLWHHSLHHSAQLLNVPSFTVWH